MADSQCLQVARVQDAHGIRGELYIRFRNPNPQWLEGRQEVHLSSEKGQKQILSIEKLRLHKEGAIVKVKEINDRTAAESLKGYFWEIAKEELVAGKGEAPYLHEIHNFLVEDKVHGELGRVSGFHFNGAHDILEVKGPKGEYDIPFVDAYIHQLQMEQQKISLELPEGLLEL